MTHRRPFRIAPVLLLLAAPALAGCSDGWRTSLGLKQTAPDEFKVAEREPLTMPPSLNDLPPPRPGAGRPQATSPRTRARQALFASSPGGQATQTGALSSGGLTGGSSAAAGERTSSDGALSDGERRLLTRANAGAAPDDIREIVARESEARAEALRGPLDDYIFWQDSPRPGEAVDAPAEARRLRENRAQGKPLTAGEVPVEQRRDRGILGDL